MYLFRKSHITDSNTFRCAIFIGKENNGWFKISMYHSILMKISNCINKGLQYCCCFYFLQMMLNKKWIILTKFIFEMNLKSQWISSTNKSVRTSINKLLNVFFILLQMISKSHLLSSSCTLVSLHHVITEAPCILSQHLQKLFLNWQYLDDDHIAEEFPLLLYSHTLISE